MFNWIKKIRDRLLCWAAREGHIRTARLLIKLGADVNAKDKYGNTALKSAARGGHKEIVELLFKHNADVNAKDNYGNTALESAARGGYKDIVERLLKEEGVDAKYVGQALEGAARRGHKEIVELLLNKEVNADHMGKALESAIKNTRVETTELLLKHGANIDNIDDPKGDFLLIIVMSKDSTAVNIVKLLLNQGVNFRENSMVDFWLSPRGEGMISEEVKKLILEHEAKRDSDEASIPQLAEARVESVSTNPQHIV